MMEESPGREEQQCLRTISVYVSHYKKTQKDGKKIKKTKKININCSTIAN